MFEYLRQAPSEGETLVDKLVLLCGFYGGLRSCSLLCRVELRDTYERRTTCEHCTEQDGSGRIRSSQANADLDEDAVCPVHYYNLYREAVGERGRLFLHFKLGKFVNSPLGKNVIAAVPLTIARFLELEDARRYTGHTLRVTSATVLADSGVNTLMLKRHGRWRIETVAEEYVRESEAVRG